MYTGSEPYAFISYAHADREWIQKITKLLDENGIRFWFDNGIHSGDDWNMVIASRLEEASACLLLLSPDAARSIYVKNELNFAISHSIPIYTLLLSSFSLPLDLEMMLGRLQMTEAKGNYQKELLAALPPELSMHELNDTSEQASRQQEGHPLYEIAQAVMDRQGTISYKGYHRRLKYPCLIQVDPIKEGDAEVIREQAVLACSIRHPLFPGIYDVEIRKNRVWSYQEYRGEQFLDQYLRQNQLSEETILSWANEVLDAMEALRRKKLGIREFSRGSMVVLDNGHIGMFRLHNPYYGVVKLSPEMESSFFEKEAQAMALLLAQLCLGKIPPMPVGLLKSEQFSQQFLDRVNVVVQKCMGEVRYSSLAQLRENLNSKTISPADRIFLMQCAERLEQYEHMKYARRQIFTQVDEEPKIVPSQEETCFAEDLDSPGFSKTADPIIVQICSTGEVRSFFKSSVTIGRSADCDLILNRKTVSRHHAKIEKTDGEYRFYDLSPTNGSYICGVKVRTAPGEGVVISKQEIIRAGSEELRIL